MKEVGNYPVVHPKDIKLIYKHFPLSMHPHAPLHAGPRLPPRIKVSSGRCTTCCS